VSGVRTPDAEMMREITRVRDRILDAVAPESNFTAVAQAALIVWAGMVKMDRGITNTQAREVALLMVDHYFPREN